VGTVGIGICGGNKEYFDQRAIAMLLTHFPEGTFRVFGSIDENFDDFSLAQRTWCEDKHSIFGVIHADPRNPHIPDLIYQFSEKLGEGFLVGGLTSSRQQYVHIANEIVAGGLSGVLFSSAIPVATRLTQGCSILGKRHYITEASHNIVIRLDGRPALEVFSEDIGEELAEDMDKIAGLIFAGLPVRGSDTGDYVVRNLLGVDPEHQLLAIGQTITAGMTILFTRRDPYAAYEDLVRVLKNLKDNLPHLPKGGLYYSCLGRGKNLFGNDSQELRAIQTILGDFPLVGFFANGEISHQRLYNYTGVLTVFL
jgi:small ligand-binding sensory domain FIST